jgi:hypothetical protein
MGVTFYELLTTARLFDPKATRAALAEELARFDPRNLLEKNLTIPDGLERVVLRSMASRPEDRYRSALEFLEDVNDYAYEAGIRLLDAHFAQYVDKVLAGRAPAGQG